MTTAQVIETSVTVNDNSPIQDYVNLDSTYFWNDSWVQTFHRSTLMTFLPTHSEIDLKLHAFNKSELTLKYQKDYINEL